MTRGAGEEGGSPDEIVARLLGTTVEEMRENPEAVKAKLVALFRELAQTGDAAEGRPEPEATREVVRRVRRELQARGVEVPDELDNLPERLREFYALLQGTTPDEVAERLRGLANLIESPGEQNAELDDVVVWLETKLGPLVGLERARRKREERLQAEYRDAAKRSIAASLRKVGIEPLSTETESPAPRSKMNRHRLFWKEFEGSASDIKDLLAGGEAEAARKKLADMLDAFDLNLAFELSLEGEDAALTFPPPDDPEMTMQLQIVIRDSPGIDGWRVLRGRRYGANRKE
jgi:hypothetical protein